MEIRIHTHISDEWNENEMRIEIYTSKNSEMLNKIIDQIQSVSNHIDTIIGMKENHISIIPTTDIIYFYSNEHSNYCKTEQGEFKIKKKLYELEEGLNHNIFIRISNSCIANVRYIQSFDLSRIGNIVVKFLDGTSQDVSKRRIPQVMKFLKERGN